MSCDLNIFSRGFCKGGMQGQALEFDGDVESVEHDGENTQGGHIGYEHGHGRAVVHFDGGEGEVDETCEEVGEEEDGEAVSIDAS